MNSSLFHYKDGAENQLHTIFQSKDYNRDTTWFDYRSIWNIYYHLSPERKNLLNWGIFEGENKLDILEIGSGCGAITSALVEIDEVASITCVEGEISRSKASQARFKGDEKGNKIKFVNANISDYQPESLFDAVVVIGVLEYSGKYIDHDTPYLEFLNIVKRFLKPEGKLILAIENQLGHKYLAGADEDHYQLPYIGISDYQQYTGIRTFTKDEMIHKLNQSGFKYQRFYYPFPDYKMPKVILSEDSFTTKDFDWLTLLDFPTNQYTKKPNYQFDEKAFLNLIKDNADPGVFMNSFLIVASAKEIELKNEKMLAAKMNITRHPDFRSIKKFNYTNQGEIEVVESKLSTGEEIRSKYIQKTDNLSILLVDAILSENIMKVKEYMTLWEKILDENTIHRSEQSKDIIDIWKSYTSYDIAFFYRKSTSFLSNNKIDLIPNNILISGDQNFIIDLEWKLSCDVIPKELILDRGMFWIVNRVLRVSGRSGHAISNGKWNIPKSIQTIIPIHDYQSIELFESWFQVYSCKGEVSACEAIDGVIKQYKNPMFRMKNWFKWIAKKQLEHLKRSSRIVRLAEIIKE